MKCDVAKDLMTLYVEEMCSEESARELEGHLKECESCAKQLERFKAELKEGGEAVKADYTEQNIKALKPMKKVKKSLLRRKIVTIILSLIIVALLTVAGILSYGQMTNRGISFSAIADVIFVKSVCEDLAEGDTQAFLDVVAFRIEDVYQTRSDDGSLNKSFEEYKKFIKESMDEAYEYYFKGKDIDVVIEEVYLTPYGENVADNMADNFISVGFYENKQLIYTMDFGKVTQRKYMVSDYSNEYGTDYSKPTFTANLLPYETVILDICLRHATHNQYNELIEGEEVESYAPGLSLMIEKSVPEDERKAFKDGMKERVAQMYADQWYIKDIFYGPDYFDVEENRWIYKVWFEMEDQETGNIAVMEQKFAFFYADLYILEDEEPVILATKGEVSEEMQEMFLNLFR